MSNRRATRRRFLEKPVDSNDRRLRTNLKPARQQQQRLIGLRFVGKGNMPDSAEPIDVMLRMTCSIASADDELSIANIAASISSSRSVSFLP